MGVLNHSLLCKLQRRTCHISYAVKARVRHSMCMPLSMCVSIEHTRVAGIYRTCESQATIFGDKRDKNTVPQG